MAPSRGQPCGNCGSELTAHWCAYCGQRQLKRLRLADLLRTLGGVLFDLDGPLCRTLRDFTSRPGDACRDYLAGARRRYFNPLKYLFWVVTLYLLIVAVTGTDLLGELRQELSPDQARALEATLAASAYLVFVRILFLAGFQAILFPRYYGFAECYAAQAFISGHATWLFILAIPLQQYSVLPSNWLAILILGLYQTWFLYRLYGGGAWTLLRAIALFLLWILLNALANVIIRTWLADAIAGGALS